MAPLLGLLSISCGLCFLVGIPVMTACFAWEDRRQKKLSAGLLVLIVMLVVFYASAGLIWRMGTADWNLSFLTTLEASVNSEKYGHPIEHRAERMVVWLLLESTFIAVVAAALAAEFGPPLIKRLRRAQ